MSAAKYRVRVNWDGLDFSFAGGSADVTNDVLNFATKIGRDRMQGKVNVGTCDLSFYDKGKYNPYNASSPIYGKILPMRAMMIDCSLDGGGTYPYCLFKGWSRTGQSNPDIGEKRASMHCEDVFLRLSRVKPVIEEMGRVDTKTALTAILNASGLSSLPKDLDFGDIIAHFSADGTIYASALISNLMDLNQALFFQAPNGTISFFDRNRWMNWDSIGTITLAQASLPGYDLESIVNYASLTAEGGVEQIIEDATSQATYGEGDFGGIGDSSYLRDDTHAHDLADYIVQSYKNPNDRVWDVNVSEGPAGYLPIILSANLVNTVTLNTSLMAGDFLIENIQHKGEGGTLHQTSWGLRVRPATIPFRLNDSLHGLDRGLLTY